MGSLADLVITAGTPAAVDLFQTLRSKQSKGAGHSKYRIVLSDDNKEATVEPLHRPAVAELVPLPDPSTARDVGEFVGMLRQVRAYSGLTLRDIEERGERYQLPRSSVSDMLKKKEPKLPKRERMAHYLAVCGLDEEQILHWEAARRRLAMEQAS